MTEVSLAWLLTKATAPVVGATKFSHVDGAAKAVELELTADEIDYLEELYVPHALVGVMRRTAGKRPGMWYKRTGRLACAARAGDRQPQQFLPK